MNEEILSDRTHIMGGQLALPYNGIGIKGDIQIPI
jgi:hypothetical protein